MGGSVDIEGTGTRERGGQRDSPQGIYILSSDNVEHIATNEDEENFQDAVSLQDIEGTSMEMEIAQGLSSIDVSKEDERSVREEEQAREDEIENEKDCNLNTLAWGGKPADIARPAGRSQERRSPSPINAASSLQGEVHLFHLLLPFKARTVQLVLAFGMRHGECQREPVCQYETFFLERDATFTNFASDTGASAWSSACLPIGQWVQNRGWATRPQFFFRIIEEKLTLTSIMGKLKDALMAPLGNDGEKAHETRRKGFSQNKSIHLEMVMPYESSQPDRERWCNLIYPVWLARHAASGLSFQHCFSDWTDRVANIGIPPHSVVDSLQVLLPLADQIEQVFCDADMAEEGRVDADAARRLFLCMVALSLVSRGPGMSYYGRLMSQSPAESDTLASICIELLKQLGRCCHPGILAALPQAAHQALNAGAKLLVKHASLFSYDWLTQLELLYTLDPGGSFCRNVQTCKLASARLKEQEKEYLAAIRHMVSYTNGNQTEGNLGLLLRAAIDSSPTPIALIEVSLLLEGIHGMANGFQGKEKQQQERGKLLCKRLLELLKVLPLSDTPGCLLACQETVIKVDKEELFLAVIEKAVAEFWQNFVLRVHRTAQIDLPSIDDLGRLVQSSLSMRSLEELSGGETRFLEWLAKHANLQIRAVFLKAITKLAGPGTEEQTLLSSQLLDLCCCWVKGASSTDSQEEPVGTGKETCVGPIYQAIVNLCTVVFQGRHEKFVSRVKENISASLQNLQQSLPQLLQSVEGILQLEDEWTEEDFVHLVESALDRSPRDQIGVDNLLLLTRHKDPLSKTTIHTRLSERIMVAVLDRVAGPEDFEQSLLKNLQQDPIKSILSSHFCLQLLQISDGEVLTTHPLYKAAVAARDHFQSRLLQGKLSLPDVQCAQACPAEMLATPSVSAAATKEALKDAEQVFEEYQHRLAAVGSFLELLCRQQERVKNFVISDLSKWQSWLAERMGAVRSLHAAEARKECAWNADLAAVTHQHRESLLRLRESATLGNVFGLEIKTACNKHVLESLGEPSSSSVRPAEASEEVPLAPMNVDDEDGEPRAFEENDEELAVRPGAPSAAGSCRLSFATLASQVLPAAMTEYRCLWQPYFSRGDGPSRGQVVLMGDVAKLWTGLTADMIRKEFRLAAVSLGQGGMDGSRLKSKIDPELIADWLNLQEKKEGLAVLQALRESFMLTDVDHIIRAWMELTDCDREDLSIATFSDTFKQAGRMLGYLSLDAVLVFKELVEAGALVEFVKETAAEDVRHWIDAVEEHSEDFLREGAIVDFIDIHGLLRPLCTAPFPTLRVLNETLTAYLERSRVRASGLAEKIAGCSAQVYALRQFFATISNRGLMMKDHMQKVLLGGTATFRIVPVPGTEGEGSSSCGVELVCGATAQARAGAGESTYSLSDLQDMRGRARLLMNSSQVQMRLSSGSRARSTAATAASLGGRGEEHKNTDTGAGSDACADTSVLEDMRALVGHVDLVERVADTVLLLHEAGHFSFGGGYSSTQKGWRELDELDRKLKGRLEQWQEALAAARRQHPSLTYYQASDLSFFLSLLRGSAIEHVRQVCLDLLQWVRPQASALSVQLVPGAGITELDLQTSEGIQVCLDVIGAWLDRVLQLERSSGAGATREAASRAGTSEGPLGVGGPVAALPGQGQGPEPGPGPVTLILTEGQQAQMNLAVALYCKHGYELGAIAKDVLLCQSSTTWEEVQLLLDRRLAAAGEQALLCIVSIELLSYEIQGRLMAALKDYSTETAAQSKQPPGELALVANAGCQIAHMMAQQLNLQPEHPQGLADADVQLLLQAVWGTMHVVTSEMPGMGKTRSVRSQAAQAGAELQTVSINGVFSRHATIARLKQLPPSSAVRPVLLHLDIGAVNDTRALNAFLFELLVLRCAKSFHGTVYRLSARFVEVEIANTLGNALAEGLPLCAAWLQPRQVAWQLEGLHADQAVSSDVQVVCIYLDFLERGMVNTRDIFVSGPGVNVAPLPPARCQALLQRHFIEPAATRVQQDPHHGAGHAQAASHALLDVFLALLATNLRCLSESYFFLVETLADSSPRQDVRSLLVQSFLAAAREQALRSVKPWLLQEQQRLLLQHRHQAGSPLPGGPRAPSPEEDEEGSLDSLMEARMQGLVRWSDTNHLTVLFHHDRSCITVLYRDPALVPPAIRELIVGQQLRSEARGLKNYAALPSHALWRELFAMLHDGEPPPQPEYAFTPDNVLKMGLIWWRLQAGAPVLIMGETGCGKTKLIETLARTAAVSYRCKCMHAGTTRESIIRFVAEANEEAATAEEQVWVFLDEINTCDHLGLLKELVCRRVLDDAPVHANLAILAACNPYRRVDKQQVAIGLGMKAQQKQSGRLDVRLAYRVHPLPEAMLDYVIDYGILERTDERAYIASMVGAADAHAALLAALLDMSQEFARACGGHACVSLRDVQRCLRLRAFFLKDLPKRPLAPAAAAAGAAHRMRATRGGSDLEERAIVLAFAHCYYVRLASMDERGRYCTSFAATWARCGEASLWGFLRQQWAKSAGQNFVRILGEEQMDLLWRMELPPGTAPNKALHENVFVVLVCMLTRTPVFVVGKPGSGKTLALQIIYSNMRGQESRDAYFQRLPKMYILSYQGSESSTSEGILKVFEKARRHASNSNRNDLLVVLVLDEVGLAEVSAHNPLKVLHAMLEPESPEVAVVGISNWALDSAKMNRAIHLSQPDPGHKELAYTARAIMKSCQLAASVEPASARWAELLQRLPQAYLHYLERQSQYHFHGLRDFYSLVKSLARTSLGPDEEGARAVALAVARNFGGSPADADAAAQLFEELTGQHCSKFSAWRRPAELGLIRENLRDRDARHLLLITNGESGADIMEHFFRDDTEGLTVIHGSHYRNDCSDDYSYSLLSNIILHMETGRRILLKDVNCIWTALYDMLNQHYTYVGGRRNCRIALGPYSNPMCYVHPAFRCVVMVDAAQVPSMDPPFLNRFEKQVVTYMSLIADQQQELLQKLQAWVDDISTVLPPHGRVGRPLPFGPSDVFAGFHKDTLPSLVILNSHSAPAAPWAAADNPEAVLQRCKELLLQTAFADGVLRARRSWLARRDPGEVEALIALYFERPQMDNLTTFVKHVVEREEEWPDSLGHKVVVTTRSIAHINVSRVLEGLLETQVERLGSFTAERQLVESVHLFFSAASRASLLLLQAHATLDQAHIAHAKFTVDRCRAEYARSLADNDGAGTRGTKKHVVLVIHDSVHEDSKQAAGSRSMGLSFLCGWQLVTLDVLEPVPAPVRTFMSKTVTQIVEEETYSLPTHAARIFTWALATIEYPPGIASAEHIQGLVSRMCDDGAFLACLRQRVLAELPAPASATWQEDIACSRGKLRLSATLYHALMYHVEECLQAPVAKLLFLAERNGSLKGYFAMGPELQEVWRGVFCDRHLLSAAALPEPRHPAGQRLPVLVQHCLPFSRLCSSALEADFRGLYLEKRAEALSQAPLGSTAAAPAPAGPAVGAGAGDDGRACTPSLMLEREMEAELEQELLEKLEDSADALLASSMLQVAAVVKRDVLGYGRDLAASAAAAGSAGLVVASRREALAWEFVLLGNTLAVSSPLLLGSLHPLHLHAAIWRNPESLAAQARLASACMSEEQIAEELDSITGGGSGFSLPTIQGVNDAEERAEDAHACASGEGSSSSSRGEAGFLERLAICCSQALLPLPPVLARLGLNKWRAEVTSLLSVAAPVAQLPVIVLMQTLWDCVRICCSAAAVADEPLSSPACTNIKAVHEIAAWAAGRKLRITLEELYDAVLHCTDPQNVLQGPAAEDSPGSAGSSGSGSGSGPGSGSGSTGPSGGSSCWDRFHLVLAQRCLQASSHSGLMLKIARLALYHPRPPVEAAPVLLELLKATELGQRDAPATSARASTSTGARAGPNVASSSNGGAGAGTALDVEADASKGEAFGRVLFGTDSDSAPAHLPITMGIEDDVAVVGRTMNEEVAVLVCDLVERHFCPPVSVAALCGNGEHNSWSMEALLPCLPRALQLATRGGDEEEALHLQRLCALALVKSTLRALAGYVAQLSKRAATGGASARSGGGVKTRNGASSSWGVGSLFAWWGARASEPSIDPKLAAILADGLREKDNALPRDLRMFLFKELCLAQGLSLSDVGALCKSLGGEDAGDAGIRAALASILDPMALGVAAADALDKLGGLDPFWSAAPAHQRAEAAIVQHVIGNRKDLEDALKELPSSSGAPADAATPSVGLLSAVASRFYLGQAGGDLTSAEAGCARWLASEKAAAPGLPERRRILLGHLAGATFPTGTILAVHSDMQSAELHLAAAAAHLAITVEALPDKSPLAGYLTLSKAHLAQAFFLGAPSDEASAVLTVLGATDNVTRYRCSCGFLYVIANCGNAVQASTCPSCKQRVGAEGHTATVPGSTRLDNEPRRMFEAEDKPGYILDPASRTETVYSQRDLAPAVYRCLQIVTHVALLVGSCLAGARACGASSKLLPGLPGKPEALQVELSNIVLENVAFLEKILTVTRETVCLCLHALCERLPALPADGPLLAANDRAQWEGLFAQRCRQVLAAPLKTARLFRARQGQGQSQSQRLVECAIEERDKRADRPLVTRLLRYTGSPGLEHLRMRVLAHPEQGRAFPLLARFLARPPGSLGTVKHASALLQWTRAVHARLSFRVTRSGALGLTVQDVLQQAAEGGESNRMEALFAAFVGAWNALRPEVARFRCHEFKEPPPVMHAGQPIALCLVEARESGEFLCGMLEHAALLQNDFLRAAWAAGGGPAERQLAAEGAREAGGVEMEAEPLEPEDDAAAGGGGGGPASHEPNSIPIQSCSASHVIEYSEEWAGGLVLSRSMCHLAYGRGQEVQYDLHSIQERLAAKLVTGKLILLTDELQEFQYQGEALCRQATLLADVTARVPQEALPPDLLRPVLEELRAARPGAGAFLSALQLCLSFVRRTGGSPEELLLAYCERWLAASAAELLRPQRTLCGVRLRHLASLYEALEDCLSVSIEDFVHSKYRVALPDEARSELLTAVKPMVSSAPTGKATGAWPPERGSSSMVTTATVAAAAAAAEAARKVLLDAFEAVLRRFMFRYLSADVFAGDIPLSTYLGDERLAKWPLASEEEAERALEMLPDSLLVEHAFTAHQMLCSLLEA